MAKLLDLARCYVTSTGTGPLTLGPAVPGYLTLPVAGAVAGQTYSYAIRDGNNSEIGRGVWNGTTFTRNVLKSTASDTAINVTTNAQFFITPSAEDLVGAVGSWTYWKFLARSADPTQAPLIQNLQLRASVGGSGVTPSSTSASSGTSANAFNSTGWQPAFAKTTTGNLGTFSLGDNEQALTVVFSTPQSIVEIALNTSANAQNSLALLDVFVSNDNKTWYPMAGFTVDITNSGQQVFGIPTLNMGGLASGGGSGGGGATALSALTDVNVTEGAPIDGYYLKWDQTTGKWIASAVSGGGGGATTLSALTDVNVTEGSSINGYGVFWDNTTSKWIAKKIAGVQTGIPAHAYWRLTLTNGRSGFFNLAGVDFEAGAAGSGTPTPVTWTIPSAYSAASNWVNVPHTGAEIGYDGSTPVTLVAHFTTPQAITNVRITGPAGFATEIPDGYALAWSDDGTTWNALTTWSGSAYTLNGVYDTSIPSPVSKDTLIGNWSDYPTSYSGQGGKGVRVNSGATGLEFYTLPAAGITTLAGLSDVSIAEGAPIDGDTLNWNQTAGKWVATAPVTGGTGGGGSSGSPANMEFGPYAPPAAAWFDTTHHHSILTVTTTDVTGRGLQVALTGGNGFDQGSLLLRSVSGWGTSWTVTARIVTATAGGQYPTIGLCAFDSGSGKYTLVGAYGNSAGCKVGVQRRPSVTGYDSAPKDNNASDIPKWFRLALSGGNLIFSLSWDGVNFFSYTESATAYLPAITHVGPCFVGVGNEPAMGDTRFGGLITYYDDPDHAATAIQKNLQAA